MQTAYKGEGHVAFPTRLKEAQVVPLHKKMTL
jgi:hypothetical protein